MLTIYKSSAGAGKTFMLVSNYLDMLFTMRGKNRHRHILAVTYTKKATAEMKERIVSELIKLSNGLPSDHAADLMSKHSLTNADLQAEAKIILQSLLTDYSAFAVTTIDSFFQQIVRSFARELNISGSYNIELDSEHILHAAVDDFFFNLPEDTTLPVIDSLLRIVNENIDEGNSWDPRFRLYKLSAELLKEKYREFQPQIYQLLKANPQLLPQVIKQMRAIKHAFIEGFHNIQKEYQQLMQGREDREFKNGKNALIPFHWSDSDLKDFMLKPEFKKTFSSFLQQTDFIINNDDQIPLANQLHDLAIRLADYVTGKQVYNYSSAYAVEQYLSYLELLRGISEAIAKANERLNRLPIADTAPLLNTVISEQESSPFIYDKVGVRIHHYLIDEFQDTSRMQWRNFKPLIDETNSSGHSNLIVGDAKQCIYRWRNSDYNLLAQEVEHTISNSQEIAMYDNWRSAKAVVNANNKVFDLLANAFQEQFNARTHKASHTTNDNNKIVNIYRNLCQNYRYTKTEGYVKMEFLPIANDNERRQEIVSRLADLVTDINSRGIPYGKIAILIKRKAEAVSIVQSLAAANIPSISNEGLRLSASVAIQLLMKAVDCILFPTNVLASISLLQQYHEITEQMLPSQALSMALNEVNNNPLADMLSRAAQMPITNCFDYLIRNLKLGQSTQYQTYLTAFWDRVFAYQKKYPADLYSFRTWWQENEDDLYLSLPANSDAVQVMTIHKSKGLEFDAVIIPFCDWEIEDTKHTEILWLTPKDDVFSANQQLPVLPVKYAEILANSCFSSDYFSEMCSKYIDSLNVTYVAFTRSKKELYVFAPQAEVDKKNKMNLVGGILHSVLKANDLLTNDAYVLGTKAVYPSSSKPRLTMPIPEVSKNTDSDNRPTIKRFSTSAERDTANIDVPVNLGNVMHCLLQCIKQRTDEQNALNKLLSEGKIKNDNLPIIQQQLQLFWQLVEPYDWFNADYEVLNERTILLPDSTTRRPDRIMIRQNQALVIDYKFGNAILHDHQKQVQRYMKSLQTMGYQVKGYLCYVNLQQIIEVI